MTSGEISVCRKCGVENPPLNQYCRQCGAVLNVSTTIIRAQRLPAVPKDLRFKWRFVGVGVFVMLGVASAAIAIALLMGLRVGVATHGVIGGLATFSVSVGAIFFVSFGISGFLLSLLAGRAVGREAFVSAMLVVTLLGVVGSTLVFDLLISAGVIVLPAAFSAWLGARLKRA